MKIITLSREFGSGGRELGKRLSDILGIDYYDSQIITEIAKEVNLDEKYVENRLESNVFANIPLSYASTFMVTPVNYDTPSLLTRQNKLIKEIPKRGDCIIVGRAADSLLEEYHPFRIFVYADMESKVKRCQERAEEDENLSVKELEKKIKTVDKRRSDVYEFVSLKEWGDKSSYDLCINTSGRDIKETANSLAKYLETWLKD